jgi:DNA-directed RNA polymerase specialized sigma24 family protein
MITAYIESTVSLFTPYITRRVDGRQYGVEAAIIEAQGRLQKVPDVHTWTGMHIANWIAKVAFRCLIDTWRKNGTHVSLPPVTDSSSIGDDNGKEVGEGWSQGTIGTETTTNRHEEHLAELEQGVQAREGTLPSTPAPDLDKDEMTRIEGGSHATEWTRKDETEKRRRELTQLILGELAPETRFIAEHHLMGGRTQKDVAAALGITVNAVKKRVARFREASAKKYSKNFTEKLQK